MNALALALLWAMLLAAPAHADWSSSGPVEDLVATSAVTAYQHEWTGAAVDSTNLDMATCLHQKGRFEAKFDPSVGDASTDARVFLRECDAAGTPQSDCNRLLFPPDTIQGDWAVLPLHKPYVMADARADTVGGDTARVEVRCSIAGSMELGSSSVGATLDAGSGPIVDSVSTATCASGWYLDVNRDASKATSEPCVDGQEIYLPATGDIAAIVNAAPAYTTFHMVPNTTYDLTTWSTGLNLKTGQTFDGHGAVISGALDLTNSNCDGGAWTQPGGTFWQCDMSGQRTLYSDPSDPNNCNDAYEAAPFNHDQFHCHHGILWTFPNLKLDKSSADYSEAALSKAVNKSLQVYSGYFLDATDQLNEWYRNCFYYDYGGPAWSGGGKCSGADTGNDHFRIWEDPTERSVVVNHGYGNGQGTHVYAFRMGNAPFSGARSQNITVKNVTVQFLASTPHNNGAIHTGRCDNCLVDNVNVRFNQGNGLACFESKNFEVKNSRFTDNTNTGYQGCWQNADSGVWELTDGEKFHDNYLARNGNGGYENTFGPANSKLAGATNGRIYNNKFIDPGRFQTPRATTNPGYPASNTGDYIENLWIDTNYAGWVVENNFVSGGKISGIYIEVSCNGVIRNNYLDNNAYNIKVNGSHDIDINNNYLSGAYWIGLIYQYAANRTGQNFTTAPFGGWTSPCPGQPWDGHVLNVAANWNTFVATNNQYSGQSNPGNAVLQGGSPFLSTLVEIDGSQGAGQGSSSGLTFNENCYDLYNFNGRPASPFVTINWNGGGPGGSRIYYTFERWRTVYGFDTSGHAEATFEPDGCANKRKQFEANPLYGG